MPYSGKCEIACNGDLHVHCRIFDAEEPVKRITVGYKLHDRNENRF